MNTTSKKSKAKAPKKKSDNVTALSKWNGVMPPKPEKMTKELEALMREVAEQAEKISHMQVIEQCERAGITIPKILQRISESLDAKEQKVSYSSTEGVHVYSKEMIAWGVRQKAVDQAVALMGIAAPAKSDLNVKTNTPPILVLDFTGNAGDNEE